MVRFEPLQDLGLGKIFEMLERAYAAYRKIDPEAVNEWKENWKTFDDFVFSIPAKEASFGFSTFWEDNGVGFSSWDPRQFPTAVIGHNCIVPEYRGKGLGIVQMRETIRRLTDRGFIKALVTTGESEFFLPAQTMYKRCGFAETVRGYGEEHSRFRTITFELRLNDEKV